MSSSDSQEGSSSQSQEGTAGGDEDRCLIANYPIIPRSELELGEQLGAGAYGSVYRGVWRTVGKEVTVALKKVFMLEKEADILSKVRHRNIIQFFGVSQTNPDFYIVTEFAEGGSLYDYVHADGKEIEFDQMLNWAIQIAFGVSYLHYEAPETIIHRDLKSKNVVLSGGDLVCKLCDFGTSKNLTHSWTAPTWGGTAAWMSPEIINQKEGITTATDVWSYAVVLWEMISREVPYKGLTEFRIYSMIAQQGVTLVIPDECPSQLADVMRNCWKPNPKERFDMKQIVGALECLLSNHEVTEQCGVFVKHKEEWKCKIEEQLKELEEQKIDYARKLEELSRRERALRRREESQRGVYGAGTHRLEGDVALWDEDQVCQWIRQISHRLPLKGELLDRLIAVVIHHSINGSRLLDITPKDLEYLGIYSLGLRGNLFKEVKNLRKENHRMKNFPTLQVSHQLDQQKRLEKMSQPLTFSLVIHVAMYTRQSNFDFLPKYRYKVLVDTDWEETFLLEDLPEDLRDSQSLVKEVCFSFIYEDESENYEPYRCLRPPFAVSTWLDSPLNGGTVSVVAAISYTDRVIRPRSTCIRANLADFSQPQTLDNRTVQITMRSYPTTGTLSRRNSFSSADRVQYKSSTSGDSGVSTSLQGFWRSRASTSGLTPADVVGETLSPYPPKNISKSPLWADIAAGIMGDRTPTSPVSAPTVIGGDADGAADGGPGVVRERNSDGTPVRPLADIHTADALSSAPLPGRQRSQSPPVSPIRLPKAPSIINPFFRPENLSRDSHFVRKLPHTSSSIAMSSSLSSQGKRNHQKAVPRKAGANVSRAWRRPLPIILPPRRRLSSVSHDELPEVSICPNVVSPECVDEEVGENAVMNAGIDLLPPCLLENDPIDVRSLKEECDLRAVEGGERAEGDTAIDGEPASTESKSRRRRRHRPHKRASKLRDGDSGSVDGQSECNGVQEVGEQKAHRQAVHGGCQKWSWKKFGSPEDR